MRRRSALSDEHNAAGPAPRRQRKRTTGPGRRLGRLRRRGGGSARALRRRDRRRRRHRGPHGRKSPRSWGSGSQAQERRGIGRARRYFKRSRRRGKGRNRHSPITDPARTGGRTDASKPSPLQRRDRLHGDRERADESPSPPRRRPRSDRGAPRDHRSTHNIASQCSDGSRRLHNDLIALRWVGAERMVGLEDASHCTLRACTPRR